MVSIRGGKSGYGHILHSNAHSSKKFSIGGYSILADKTRVTIERNFHKSLVTFKISDVESVEYSTNVKWMSAISSFFWFAFSYVFYFELSSAKISFWSFFFNLEGIVYVIRLLAMLFFVVGLVALHTLSTSFTGRLKLRLRYAVAPIEIFSNFSPQIPDLMRHIEEHKK